MHRIETQDGNRHDNNAESDSTENNCDVVLVARPT